MMDKKKVLIIIDWFLPGTNSGGPVRSYTNMIEHMEKEVDFFVVTRDSDYCSNYKYEKIKTGEWNNLSDNLSVYYLDSQNLKYSNLKTAISAIEFDLAIINGIYSYYFSILPLFLLRNSTKKIIVSARGMLNPQAFSVKPLRKRLYLSTAKRLGAFRNIVFHATNKDEATYIQGRLGSSIKVITAPNFPRKILDYSNEHVEKLENNLKIVNIARISEEKGTLKMLNYLKEIKSGNILLDIYGPIYDNDYWEKCKQEIALVPPNIKIEYRGVAESKDIPKILAEYHLFIMLSEGENFGHSILEAMTCGLPVIISNLTPWTNLRKQKIGWDLQLANHEEFEEAINYILKMNDDQYGIWSAAVRKYARDIINDLATYNSNLALLGL